MYYFKQHLFLYFKVIKQVATTWHDGVFKAFIVTNSLYLQHNRPLHLVSKARRTCIVKILNSFT